MNDTANIINITNHRYYPTILTNDTNQLYYIQPSAQGFNNPFAPNPHSDYISPMGRWRASTLTRRSKHAEQRWVGRRWPRPSMTKGSSIVFCCGVSSERISSTEQSSCVWPWLWSTESNQNTVHDINVTVMYILYIRHPRNLYMRIHNTNRLQ